MIEPDIDPDSGTNSTGYRRETPRFPPISQRAFTKLMRVTLVGILAFTSLLWAPLASKSAAQTLDPPNRVRIDITQMTPRVVTSATSELTFSGRLTNIGDRRITEVKVRLELGERQASERQLRASLADPATTGTESSRFLELANLEVGQTIPFTLAVKLDGSSGALQLGKPGSYPLLLNVNGTPEYGAQARLAALSMLLPVTSSPGKAPEQPAHSVGVSILWPIADTRPRLIANPYGDMPVLSDDQLAADLATGGRLDALVSAAKSIQSNQSLFSSLCFAVDPDLLNTVDAMTQPYRVRTASGENLGTGNEVAKRWLSSLKQVMTGHCAIQIPFADADVSSLARISDTGKALIPAATTNADRIQALTNAKLLPGVLWPEGAVSTDARTQLSDNSITTLVSDTAKLQAGTKATAGTNIAGSKLRAQPTDSLLALTLAQKPSAVSGSSTPNNVPGLATQNALGVLVYQSLSGTPPAKPLLLAPPHRWTAPATELAAFLDNLGDLAQQGLLSPSPLQQLISAPAAGSTAMNYSAQDTASALPTDLVESLSRVNDSAGDLRTAMSPDPTTQVNPDELIAPIRNAILRSSSSSWRGIPGGAASSTDQTDEQLLTLLHQVTVETSPQPLSLSSSNSPIPVLISSKLPVSITVRINLDNNTGLRPAPIPDQTIAANSAFQRFLGAEALRAGRFNVDVSLSTPSGTRLGNVATLELTSNEYGTVTIIVTIAAGVALFLLSGRRIYRRIRARKIANTAQSTD